MSGNQANDSGQSADARVAAALGGGKVEKLGGGAQGTIYRVDDGSRRLIVKQPMGGPLMRRLREFTLRREREAYRKLSGVAGVPGCLGLHDGDKLVLEYVEGRSLREVHGELSDAERFFSRLRDLIQAMHAAGVAHADLKRKENILVTPDETPCLIDFGSAVFRGENPGPIRRFLFREFCDMDLNAWIKLKYRRRYDEIRPEDLPFYRPTIIERIARRTRRFWRKATGRQWRKARRRARGGRS